TYVAGPAVSVSPSSVDFGSVTVGTASSAATVTLTNTGGVTLTLSSVVITAASVNQADFQIVAGGTCSNSSTLAPGQSCTTLARFKPTATGARIVLLRFWVTTTAAFTLPAALPISTSVAGPAVSVSPSSVDFGSVTVGTASSAA